MTPELKALAYAGLLQGLQYCLLSLTANLDVGPRRTLSARDPQKMGGNLPDLLGVKSGRALRAFNNHNEALILFTIAVVILGLADKNTGFSAICAWTYVGARILYVPAYFFGLTPWRSLIWLVGFLATMAMLASTII